MNDKMHLREKSNSVRLFLLDVPTHPKRTKPKIQGAIHWLSFLDCPVKLKLERFTRFCQARPSQPQRKSTLLRRGQRNIGSGSLEFFLVPGGSICDPWLHHLRGSRCRQKMAGDPRPIVDSLMDVDGTAVAPIAILYNPNHSSKTITLEGLSGGNFHQHVADSIGETSTANGFWFSTAAPTSTPLTPTTTANILP